MYLKNGQVVEGSAPASAPAASGAQGALGAPTGGAWFSGVGTWSSSLPGVLGNVVDGVYAYFASLVMPGWEAQYSTGYAATGRSSYAGGSAAGGSGGAGGRAPGPRIYGMGSVRSSQGAAGGGCARGRCG
ncbi:hypothetical protein FVE85_4691 [Porphyridium purpureum]|uniref:Uncharacterized protein n=1 Tax=Porphyridium purpureum TaxID=35688 RepID=A0A5J4YS85_PORPP|nr:hypothetical protein FVE85_4691 [Porphyridium purpureum]|eukprot:POR6971..scf236_6